MALVLFQYAPGTSVGGLGGTFARTGNATYFDANGVLQTAATGVLRDGHYINGVRTTLLEGARTNIALWCRDLTNAAWVKSNVTAALDQTGIDGTANSASSITATAGNGTVLQTVTLASSQRFQSAYVKRITGSGTVNMTTDNGATWTAITVTASWTRVTIPAQTVTNPVFGFRLVTNGDKIAVDYVGNEGGAFQSSPIATTSAAVTRNADALSFPFLPVPQAMTLYTKTFDMSAGSSTTRYLAYIADAAGDAEWFSTQGGATQWNAQHGAAAVRTTAATGSTAFGDIVEVRGVLNSDGSCLVGVSDNGGAEAVSAATATTPLTATFSAPTLLQMNPSSGSFATNPGFFAFTGVTVCAGVQSMATMRTASGLTPVSTTQALAPLAVIAERAFFAQPQYTSIDTGTATLLAATAAPNNSNQIVRALAVTVTCSAAPAAGTVVQIQDGNTPIWQVTLANQKTSYRFDFTKKPLRGSAGNTLTATMSSAGGSVVQTINLLSDLQTAP